jgi:hypothetical protein
MSFAFAYAALNGTALVGVRNAGLDRREVIIPGSADGALHQTTAAAMRAAPRASFSTLAMRDLAGVLTLNGAVPYCALNGTTGFKAVALKVGTVPGYDSGANHVSRIIASGLLVVDGISWSAGSPAEMACSVFGLSADGTTDPVASAINAALPTLPSLQEQLGLSAIALNSVAMTRVRNLQVSIGHQVENSGPICYAGDLPFPTQLTMPGVAGATEITASFDQSGFADTIGNGTLALQFRVATHNSIGLGATGINVTLATCMAREMQLDRDTRRVEVRATWNGSTNPITIAVV